MRHFMRAVDIDLERVAYPCICQPKIDGVRGGVILTDEGGWGLRSRQLKPFKNLNLMKRFSKRLLAGADLELYAGDDPFVAGLCRATTSATGTIEGAPLVNGIVFDYVTDKTVRLPYSERLTLVQERFSEMRVVKPIQSWVANTLSDLLHCEEKALLMGAEGLIVRGIECVHKEGYSSVVSGGLLRLKRFCDGEACIVGMAEGEHNGNELSVNEMGRAKRSSHAANKTRNGLLGNLQGIVCADVLWRGKRVLAAGQEITIAPGCMTHEERREAWACYKAGLKGGKWAMGLGSISKFQFFPTGGKDKPRFPTHQSIRAAEDM